jgi:EmrB/QacA subfamily drug resistance transporter
MERTKSTERIDPGKWIRIVALLGAYMTVLDCTIITIALPTISAAFQANIAGSQWTITGYLVAMTTCMLIFARLADYFGKNPIFLSGISLFTLASLGCAISPDLMTLTGMRIIQGIGAAMAMSLAMAIIFENSPLEKQGTYIGLLGAVIGLASISGPVIGGVLLDFSGWESIFLINIPIGIVLIILGLRTMDCTKPDNYRSFQMDWTGAAAFIITIVACMGGLGFIANGPSRYLHGILLLFISILSLTGFIVIEKKQADPLLDLSVFRQINFIIPLLAMMAFFCAIYILQVSLPFYLEIVWNFSSLQTGLVFMLISGILVIGTPVIGKLYDKKRWPHYTSLGLITGTAGLLLLVLVSGMLNFTLILISLVIYSIGYTLFQSPINIEIMRGLPLKQSAIASGLSNTGRHLAMTLGSSIAAIIFVFVFHISGFYGEIMNANASLIADATMNALITGAVFCFAGFILKIWPYKKETDNLSA